MTLSLPQRQHIKIGTRLLGAIAAGFLLAGSACLAAGSDPLEQGFRHVPDSDKPWAYWWWLKGNVDKATIARDLEGMKETGFGGLLMFDARGYHEDHVAPPPSRMEFMSPQWRRMLTFALQKASRLNLEVSVNLSSCAGALKGPWEVGDDAPKKLLWSALEMRGPGRFTEELRRPADRRFWEVALFAVRHDSILATNTDQWHEIATPSGKLQMALEVVDLTARVEAQGRITWEIPAGNWTLLRFGCTTMEGHEYDVDILDPKAVTGHFERMGGAILRDAGSLAGKTLTHFYSVSWEGAVPTWTLAFEREFAKYRGYAPRLWLPVLAGFTVQSREQSGRFLSDYYRALGDCFRDNFYGTMQKLCHHHGLKWHSESGGPWERKLAVFGEADQLAFLGRNDIPQGEFWFTGNPVRHRQDMNRPSAMAAHIYGRPWAAAEAFTHMAQHWSAYPGVLKPFADAAFCDGINHFIWHTFTASPRALGQPGSEYFAGTHINRNVTWFPQAGPFVDYLSRCQFLLRQGHFVSDVCAYIGDKPYQHWGRGTNWSARGTVSLPRGHTYDLINTEVLLGRLTTRDGDLVLPDGMRYRLLVVDPEDDVMPPDAMRKLAELKKAGATVVFGQRQPRLAPGLKGYPKGDDETQRLANSLWTNSPTLAAALRAQNLLPDFEGPFEYLHRRTDNADLYFASGQGTAECVFRVNDKQPELWQAVGGHIAEAARWHARADGRTSVMLDLPQNGSVFVVFRKPVHTRSTAETATPITKKAPAEIILDGPWQLRFEPGRGAPKTAVFDQLIAWNQHSDPGIKFFSGRATYRKTFELTRGQAQHRTQLHLGTVQCLARVRLNGQDLGVVWTAPWAVELTGAQKQGRNELEIDVVNTWVNRLIGDAALPAAKRITQSNVALRSGRRSFKIYQGFASEDPLMTSGLLGPVRLELWP